MSEKRECQVILSGREMPLLIKDYHMVDEIDDTLIFREVVGSFPDVRKNTIASFPLRHVQAVIYDMPKVFELVRD